RSLRRRRVERPSLLIGTGLQAEALQRRPGLRNVVTDEGLAIGARVDGAHGEATGEKIGGPAGADDSGADDGDGAHGGAVEERHGAPYACYWGANVDHGGVAGPSPQR